MLTQKNIESLKKAWVNSLTLFYPANLKLFFLVTLNTTAQVYTHLINTFSPLLILWVILEFFYFRTFNITGLILVLKIVRFSLFYLLILTIRPSTALKNYSYYMSYLGYALLYIIGIEFLTHLFRSESFLADFMSYAFLIPQAAFYCSPFILFGLLFYLDSNGGLQEALKSFYHACIMFFYNYPFCLITFFISVTLLHLFYISIVVLFLPFTSLLIARYSAYMLSTALIPFIVSFIGNFYIKKVHDQINLYTAGCKK